MITCYLRYKVNPDKLADFEAYGAMWLDLIAVGGIHARILSAIRRRE